MKEKEKKVRGRKICVFLMAMVLCLGASVSVFADIRTGSIMGLDHVFAGAYSNKTLQGVTICDDIVKNKESYVSVEFKYNSGTRYQNMTYGKYGTQAYLRATIGENSSNWRIYNSMRSKKSTSSLSVYSGAYTF